MSIDAIIKKMSEDEKFAEKYAKFDNLDAVLEQAKADGYSITKEDIEKYIASHKSGGVNGKQLSKSAGGKGNKKAWSVVGMIGSLATGMTGGGCPTYEKMSQGACGF